MKLTQEQQYMLLGVVAFIALGFVYYQFLLKPVYSQIQSLHATLDQKKKDLDTAKQTVAKYAEFKKRAASIQRELEYFQNRIPASVDRVKMLDTVAQLQSISGVQLSMFGSRREPVRRDNYTEVPIEVKFLSNYKQLLEFIHQMAFTDTLMTVDEISINGEKNVDPNVSLSAVMVVRGTMSNSGKGGKP